MSQSANKRLEAVCKKLREDKEWLSTSADRLDSKVISKAPPEVLKAPSSAQVEIGTYSLAILPAHCGQLASLQSHIAAFRGVFKCRRMDLERHVAECRKITTGDLAGSSELVPMATQLMYKTLRQAQNVENLLDATEARSQQVMALSKAFFDNVTQLNQWMDKTEAALDKVAVDRQAAGEETEILRKALASAKVLEYFIL